MSDLYEMELHDSISITDGIGDNKYYWRILRVPGGWLYTMHDDVCQDPITYQFATTFVPYTVHM